MRRHELPIDEPCLEDWDTMEGNALRRFCRKCDKHVHNLSAMTEPQARALLRRAPGICVNYASTTDGQVLFAKRRAVVRLPVLAGVGGALLAACASPGTEDPEGQRQALRGDDSGARVADDEDGGAIPAAGHAAAATHQQLELSDGSDLLAAPPTTTLDTPCHSCTGGNDSARNPQPSAQAVTQTVEPPRVTHTRGRIVMPRPTMGKIMATTE